MSPIPARIAIKDGDFMVRPGFVIVALCLLLASCAISVSNSPDWCGGNPNITCR
jgi:hypothetical protein